MAGLVLRSDSGVNPLHRSLRRAMTTNGDKPQSGDHVVITKLMLKLMSIEQANYKIAAAAGIHPTTLSNYARGTKDISAKHLIALCRLFECEPDDVMGQVEVEIA